jgi:hypothetical protein
LGEGVGLMKIDHTKLAMKMRNEAPRRNALIDAKSLSACRFWAYSNTRRGWPSRPMRNMGKKVMLKKMNIVQKWALPNFLFMVLPVIFGSQK